MGEPSRAMERPRPTRRTSGPPPGLAWYRRVLRGLLGDVVSALSLSFLFLVFLLALLAPVLTPADPLAQSLEGRLSPPFSRVGRALHFMGTDQLGRDVLSRVLFGARVSVPLAFIAATVSLAAGAMSGAYAGYFGGLLSWIIQRLIDVQIAFPRLVIAVVIVAVFGTSMLTLGVVLALFGWAEYARVAQAEVLSVKEREYVYAARAVGVKEARVLRAHVLPNIFSPLLVLWTFNFAQLIIIEGALSFIGLGVQPPRPSWGGMLSQSQTYLADAWWLSVFPGAAIMCTVLSINMFGDRLREVLDPRMSRT